MNCPPNPPQSTPKGTQSQFSSDQHPWDYGTMRTLMSLFHNRKLRPLTAGRIFGILAVTQKEKGTVYFLRRRC